MLKIAMKIQFQNDLSKSFRMSLKIEENELDYPISA